MSIELRNALGHFATGVTIVCAVKDGVDFGMTCNSFSSVSLEPPLVLWSIRNDAESHAPFLAAGGYAVSVLNESQTDLALKFSTGNPKKRFTGTEFLRLPSGRAVIGGSIAWFDCETEKVIPAGDHDILLGRVSNYGSDNGSGLVFHLGKFGKFTSPQ